MFNGLLFLAIEQTRHSELLPAGTLKMLGKNVFNFLKVPSELAKRSQAENEGKAGTRTG